MALDAMKLAGGWRTLVLAGAAALPVVALAPAPARAQMDSREAITLQNEILDLRAQVQSLRANPGGSGYAAEPPPAPAGEGGATSGPLVAQLLDRVQNLEEQVRDLRGKVEELGNQVQQQNADLSKQIGDLAFKVNGAGAQGGPPPTGPGLAPPPAAAAPVPRTPETGLVAGNAALARRDYPAAERAARQVLATTHGPRAYDAQFLLAQSLAGEHNWQGAALAYDDSYKKNRHGSRAADSLVGLAASLVALHQGPAACETLNKLNREFPGHRRVEVTSLRSRAHCH